MYLKYDNQPESKNTVTIKYIEIVDPRGNSYKFVMDASLKSGEEITLPRKPGTKPREEGFIHFFYLLKFAVNIL